jgi:hypothetical protein
MQGPIQTGWTREDGDATVRRDDHLALAVGVEVWAYQRGAGRLGHKNWVAHLGA